MWRQYKFWINGKHNSVSPTSQLHSLSEVVGDSYTAYAKSLRSHNKMKSNPSIIQSRISIETLRISFGPRSPRYSRCSSMNEENQCLNENIGYRTVASSVYTNRYEDSDLEISFQNYCYCECFVRARVIIALIIVSHVIVYLNILYTQTDKTDLFTPNRLSIEHWLQWIYLLLALPFLLITKRSCTKFPQLPNLLKIYWKHCCVLIVCFLVVSLQVWIVSETKASMNTFSVNLHNAFTTNCNLLSISNYQDKMINIAFIGMYFILFPTFGSTIVLTLQLDFLHILCSIICMCGSFWIFFLSAFSKQYSMEMLVFSISGILLNTLVLFSSYQLDRNYRHSFLAKIYADHMNRTLKACLKKNLTKEEQLLIEDSFQNNLDYNAYLNIPFTEFKLEKILKKGYYGDIILATYLGSKVVLKQLSSSHLTKEKINYFRQEIELMSSLRHPNIIQFLGATLDSPHNICYVLEYMELGDLHSLLHSKKGMSYSLLNPLLKIALEVAQGMIYLHHADPPMVHSDLKSKNLLCSKTFTCKIADLRSIIRNTLGHLDNLVGLVPYWIAPEILRNEPYGVQADCYSFGIILIEMITKNVPFSNIKNRSSLQIVWEIAHNNLRPDLPLDCCPSLRCLIDNCLLDDPKQRPSMKEVLEALQTDIRYQLYGEYHEKDERYSLLTRQKKMEYIQILSSSSNHITDQDECI